MAKKEKEEVVVEEVVVEKSAAKEAKKDLPKVNEEYFTVGDELEVKGQPFKVKEVRGLDVVLKRTDLI